MFCARPATARCSGSSSFGSTWPVTILLTWFSLEKFAISRVADFGIDHTGILRFRRRGLLRVVFPRACLKWGDNSGENVGRAGMLQTALYSDAN